MDEIKGPELGGLLEKPSDQAGGSTGAKVAKKAASKAADAALDATSKVAAKAITASTEIPVPPWLVKMGIKTTIAAFLFGLFVLVAGSLLILGVGLSIYGRFFRGLAIQNSGGAPISDSITGANGTSGTGTTGGTGGTGGAGGVEGGGTEGGATTGGSNGGSNNNGTSPGGSMGPLATMGQGVTLYVSFYVPRGASCNTITGSLSFSDNNSKMVDCANVTEEQRDSGQYSVGIVLDNIFRYGVAAVNNPGTWNNGTPYPVSSTAKKGNTFWLYVPGYYNAPTGTPVVGIPVVDVMSDEETAANRDQQNSIFGEDMKYRVNLAVESAQEKEDVIKNLKQAGNCKTRTGAPYECRVSGSIVKYGNPDIASPTNTAGTTDTTPICVGGTCSGNNSGGGSHPTTPSPTVPSPTTPTVGNSSTIGKKIAAVALSYAAQQTPASTFDRGGLPWCAFFASDVMAQAGVQNVKGIGAVDTLRNWFYFQQNLTKIESGSTQLPQVGDIVFFRGYSHVGIVVGITGNTVHTVEGNVGDGAAVYRRKYNLSNNPFSHYGRVVRYFN